MTSPAASVQADGAIQLDTDKVFAGPVPQLYDRHLGPVLFQAFADIMAERVRETDRTILETAAGTGIVTRAVAAAVPQSTILATDLNQAMLDVAAEKTQAGAAKWQQADAQALPLEADSFDTRLSMIVKAKALGFTLSEIKETLAEGSPAGEPNGLPLPSSQIADQIAHLEKQQAEIDAALAELNALRTKLSKSHAA